MLGDYGSYIVSSILLFSPTFKDVFASISSVASLANSAAGSRRGRRMYDDAQLNENNGHAHGHLQQSQHLQQQQQNGGPAGSMNGGGQRGMPLTLRESLAAGGGGMMGDDDEYMDRKGGR